MARNTVGLKFILQGSGSGSLNDWYKKGHGMVMVIFVFEMHCVCA